MIARTLISILLISLSLVQIAIKMDPLTVAVLVGAQAIAVFCLWLPAEETAMVRRNVKTNVGPTEPKSTLRLIVNK